MGLSILSILFFFNSAFSSPPAPHPVSPFAVPHDMAFDVEHYDFSLWINDDNDTLNGRASITIKALKVIREIQFDLTGLRSSGKGMIVQQAQEGGASIAFTQENQRVILHADDSIAPGQERVFVIAYKGIPADGLIYGKNKFGHRTIFGDNWPDRARNWLPCVDHPWHKARVDFEIIAPDHYLVVANGIKVKDSILDGHLRYTHWKEEVALPTKVMTIGLADFAVNEAGNVEGIPVTSWVYPEDREKGFYDYSQALAILSFYISKIGPYPYRKLANVQSTTIFGGMENANCIFYAENSITGTRRSEELLAHEIAHQWFGDAVTETDFSHLWLSEGFATFLSAAYLEEKHGPDTLIAKLKTDRDAIIAFSKRYFAPVVDTTKDYMKLLNADSYQKGGWVLYMLKEEIGDSLFWKGIRQYYSRFSGANASTQDFESVMETASGRDLKEFFQQWLFTAGHPKLHLTWKYDKIARRVNITILQQQNKPFSFVLDISLHSGDKGLDGRYTIKDKTTQLSMHFDSMPDRVQLDPLTRLLFEQD